MTKIKSLDPLILMPSISISGISIFLLLANGTNLFVPQLVFTLISILLFIIVANLDFRIWPKYIYIFYVSALFLLTVIFFLPSVRGAHRWIDFHFFVLQPSELLKPAIILFYAYIMSKFNKLDIKMIFWQLFSFVPILLLIFLQPDLGNTIIYVAFFIGLLIIGGISLKFILTSFLVFLVFLPGIWKLLREYQKERIFSFINPQLDPGGAGYNAIQSIIAIGSGGLFGLGLGRGTQSRLLFLPEYQTDFIFASLVESLGFFGGVLLITLYLILLIRILLLAFNTDNRFARLVLIGIFCQLFSQIFINIGMNIGLLPITGITLPLLSYGGSSIVSTYVSLGLVSNIANSFRKKLLVIR